jgi:hypothetical protein
MVILSMYIFYRCGILYFIFCFKLLQPDVTPEHWKETLLLSSLPIIFITILSRIYFQDSPKLHLSKKELYKAIDTVYDLAREKSKNGVFQISDRDIAHLKEEFVVNEHVENSNKVEFSYKNLFSHQYSTLIILCSFIFLCASMVNVIFIYSLPLMITRKTKFSRPNEFHFFKHDMAMEILITQIVTIPAIILSALICKLIGRKSTISMGFLLCFFATFVPCLTNKGLIVSSAFVNFFIIFAQCTIKVYIIEAFPTKLRDYALSFCFCISKIGDCLVPLMCNLSLNLFPFGPIAFASAICVTGLVASVSLPFDTLGLNIE